MFDQKYSFPLCVEIFGTPCRQHFTIFDMWYRNSDQTGVQGLPDIHEADCDFYFIIFFLWLVMEITTHHYHPYIFYYWIIML